MLLLPVPPATPPHVTSVHPVRARGTVPNDNKAPGPACTSILSNRLAPKELSPLLDRPTVDREVQVVDSLVFTRKSPVPGSVFFPAPIFMPPSSRKGAARSKWQL